MDRRELFLSGALAAGTALTPAGGAAAAPAAGSKNRRPLKARLGHQTNGRMTDEVAEYVARFGVDAICTSPTIADPARLAPTADELHRMLDIAARRKVKVEMIDSILLTSSNIDREKNPAIMLGDSPQRDRDIEAFNATIRACAATGIATLKYNMSILGVVRMDDKVLGRGDAVYNRWNAAEALAKNPPPTRAGAVTADQFWERIDYFLSRVVPVANEYKVRIACHPQDPGTPPGGYRGITNVLGTVEGLKTFVGLHESPWHGLNFCQGTVSENLERPNEQIGDVIRWFGSRKKIFNVHFRNIRGHRGDFVAEMFPDEGDVDFVKALKVYREVGYDGLLMPDHAPAMAGGGEAQQWGARENFAFEFGYIRGLLQAEAHIA